MPHSSLLNLAMWVSRHAKMIRAPQVLARIFVLVVRKSPGIWDHKHSSFILEQEFVIYYMLLEKANGQYLVGNSSVKLNSCPQFLLLFPSGVSLYSSIRQAEIIGSQSNFLVRIMHFRIHRLVQKCCEKLSKSILLFTVKLCHHALTMLWASVPYWQQVITHTLILSCC